jgi:hypothetical protein
MGGVHLETKASNSGARCKSDGLQRFGLRRFLELETIANAAKSLAKARSGRRLQEIIDHVELVRALRVIVAADEGDERHGLFQHPDNLKATNIRHFDIEEHEIRVQAVDHFYRFDAIGRLANDLDVLESAQRES